MTTPYDPATSLRADATDEQILARGLFIFHEGTRPAISIARELQAATVAEYEAKIEEMQKLAASLDTELHQANEKAWILGKKLAMNVRERVVINAAKAWRVSGDDYDECLRDMMDAVDDLTPSPPSESAPPPTNTPYTHWWLSDLPNPGPYYESTMMNVVRRALGIDTEEEALTILRTSDFRKLFAAPPPSVGATPSPETPNDR